MRDFVALTTELTAASVTACIECIEDGYRACCHPPATGLGREVEEATAAFRALPAWMQRASAPVVNGPYEQEK